MLTIVAGSLDCLFGSKIDKIQLPLEDRDPQLDHLYQDTRDTTSSVAMPEVTLEDGRKLKTRLLVGADGAQSMVRTSANIGVSSSDYNQRAVVAALATDRRSDTAYQRFLPLGPLAMLPVSCSSTKCVWLLMV